MDLNDAIMNRRSIRKYKDKEIDDNLINKIVEAGIWAPSAGDLQAWEVIVVKGEQSKTNLCICGYLRDFIAEAPIILVICAHTQKSGAFYGERGRELYCIQDAACATQNMLLKIHELGLSACWIGSFEEESVSEKMEIPKGVRPVAMIPIGYPDENPVPPPRREIKECIHYEKY